MIVDIIIAFLIALLMNIGNKYLKQITIFASCLTTIIVYFVNGCQINFIGEIDFGIWITFVIIFDIALAFAEIKLKKYIKE